MNRKILADFQICISIPLISFYPPLESLETWWFSGDFRGIVSELMCLNSFNIRREIWRRPLKIPQPPEVLCEKVCS